PSEMWRHDLEELKENGMDYLVVPVDLQKARVMVDEEVKANLFRFLDTAEYCGIGCILCPRPSLGLYLDPEVRESNLTYVRAVTREIGKHPAVYGFELEDEPDGRLELPEEAWKPFTGEVVETLQSQNLTSVGYERALRRWKMDQFTEYVEELVGAIKQVNPRLKVEMCFNIPAVIPRWNLVNMEEVAQHLDFVLVDVYPGWQLERYEHGYISAFMARLVRSLTDREVWFLLGGHIVGNRYQSSLREIRTWSRRVLDQGVNALGWYALDFTCWSDRYNTAGLPTKVSNPERWKTMLEISHKAAKEEVKPISPSPYAMLFPYDSILSLYDHMHFLVPYVTLTLMVGLDLWYVSDNRISEDQGALEGHTHLFTTPCPWMRKEVVDRILRFVESGGILIASSDDFAMNEELRAAEARKELLGIVEEEPFYDEDTIEIVEDMEGLVAGTRLSTYWNRIKIKKVAEGSQVIGRWSDGTPAIFRRTLGKGDVLYVGTNPYWAALYPERDEGWNQFLRTVVSEAS
ncbi:beta-galactosidase trimerization domain-containing protein, partial [candidate division WOR-3 bacterium]|nr:beta-galactosidase trimerization domain-containing protein [candidate division WOR-3 bacterium]